MALLGVPWLVNPLSIDGGRQAANARRPTIAPLGDVVVFRLSTRSCGLPTTTGPERRQRAPGVTEEHPVSSQDTGTTRGGDTQVLRDLIGLAFEQGDLAFALNRVTSVIAAGIPGADDVSVTLDDKEPRTVAFSGELAADGDESQYDVDSGPCLQAMRQNEVVRVDELETETRWPAYRPRGLAAGVRSSLSLPLQAGERIVGALNI